MTTLNHIADLTAQESNTGRPSVSFRVNNSHYLMSGARKLKEITEVSRGVSAKYATKALSELTAGYYNGIIEYTKDQYDHISVILVLNVVSTDAELRDGFDTDELDSLKSWAYQMSEWIK